MTFPPVLAIFAVFVLALALYSLSLSLYRWARWKFTSNFDNITLENLDQKRKKSVEVKETADKSYLENTW